ncbi:hypothetical protein [Sandaracinobacteroides saxicola]|uniref:Uncharacterized protein n=1 Tax=Sandaracinobacteroides saxicola TaxID=2759707 RepID=A0A7G5IKH8_9SPHN|nr:hypothetical protein [Sandaracinobacteroides saxicola]QMW23870.1 hypothetical protein H3309_05200 [Sandaracinobacteroides saxicola]
MSGKTWMQLASAVAAAMVVAGCEPDGLAKVDSVRIMPAQLTCGEARTVTATTVGAGAEQAQVVFSNNGPVTLATPATVQAAAAASGRGGEALLAVTGGVVVKPTQATVSAEVKNSGQSAITGTVTVTPCPGTAGHTAGTGWAKGTRGTPATGDPVVTVTPVVTGKTLTALSVAVAGSAGAYKIRSIDLVQAADIEKPGVSPAASGSGSLPAGVSPAKGWFYSFNPCVAAPVRFSGLALAKAKGPVTLKVRLCESVEASAEVEVEVP